MTTAANEKDALLVLLGKWCVKAKGYRDAHHHASVRLRRWHFLLGVPAIVLGLVGFFLGRSALKRIRASGGARGGHGVATAGWIIGLIAAALGLLLGLILIGAAALVLTGVIPTPSPSP